MRLPIERRVEGARGVGDHKASMLQDVENGRPMEVEGVTGAVVEIARKMECSTPFLDAVHGTVSMLAWVLEKKCKKSRLWQCNEAVIELLLIPLISRSRAE